MTKQTSDNSQRLYLHCRSYDQKEFFFDSRPAREPVTEITLQDGFELTRIVRAPDGSVIPPHGKGWILGRDEWRRKPRKGKRVVLDARDAQYVYPWFAWQWDKRTGQQVLREPRVVKEAS